MKFLFINPPVFNDVGNVRTETPPLGILYLAAYLEKNGYKDIRVVDADAAMLAWEQLETLIKKEKPDILGITSPSFMMPALWRTAEIARKNLPNCTILAGGYGPTKEPEKTLTEANKAIDFVVMGEGEITLIELVKRLESGEKRFNDIKGLAFRSFECHPEVAKDLEESEAKQCDSSQAQHDITITEPRGYIMDLDSIPFPAYHLLTPHFSKYPGIPFHEKEVERPTATMFASRGCPHRCTFCSLGAKVYRSRSPKNVVDEIQMYRDQFGVKGVQIYDDEFMGLSPQQNKWIEEICDEIIKRGLHKEMSFIIQARCSKFISLDTLKKMKQANFVWIWWGVESGSQKILDLIKKDILIEDIYRVFGLAKQAGIKSLMFIMVGFPGEAPKDIKLSSDLIRKIKPDRINVHIVSPYPGAEMHKYFVEHNLFETDEYYKSDSLTNAMHHTEEMTAEEIKKYYKMIRFRYKNGNWHWIKFMAKSLLTIDGWKKLEARINKAGNYFLDWIKIKIA